MSMMTVGLVRQGLQSEHGFGSLLLCMEAAGIEAAARSLGQERDMRGLGGQQAP